VPAAVVVFLGAVIAVYAVGAWRGRQPDLRGEGDQEPEHGALARTLWLLGGGAAFMALVQPLGFILPAALCGVGVARAFDAPLSWRTGVVCLLIAGVFWITFAAGLGVGLGPAFAGLG
jgi:putative tricarboxylic transport membrane protein